MQPKKTDTFELVDEKGVRCTILLHDAPMPNAFLSQLLPGVCTQLVITYWISNWDDGSTFCNWDMMELFSERELVFVLSTWWSPCSNKPPHYDSPFCKRKCFYALLFARMFATENICLSLMQLAHFTFAWAEEARNMPGGISPSLYQLAFPDSKSRNTRFHMDILLAACECHNQSLIEHILSELNESSRFVVLCIALVHHHIFGRLLHSIQLFTNTVKRYGVLKFRECNKSEFLCFDSDYTVGPLRFDYIQFGSPQQKHRFFRRARREVGSKCRSSFPFRVLYSELQYKAFQRQKKKNENDIHDPEHGYEHCVILEQHYPFPTE